MLLSAKLLSLLSLVVVLGVLARAGRHLPMGERVFTLALLAAVSTSVSPVFWRHGYVFDTLPLAFLWNRVLRQRTSALELTILSLCSIELATFLFDDWINHLHSMVSLALQASPAPAASLVLAIYFLRQKQLRSMELPRTTL